MHSSCTKGSPNHALHPYLSTPCLHAGLQVIDDPAGSKLLLVMEFMEGGPVLTREALEKRERLPEPLALQYFRDMIKVRPGLPRALLGLRGCDC